MVSEFKTDRKSVLDRRFIAVAAAIFNGLRSRVGGDSAPVKEMSLVGKVSHVFD